jgi:hypothetical protein
MDQPARPEGEFDDGSSAEFEHEFYARTMTEEQAQLPPTAVR